MPGGGGMPGMPGGGGMPGMPGGGGMPGMPGGGPGGPSQRRSDAAVPHQAPGGGMPGMPGGGGAGMPGMPGGGAGMPGMPGGGGAGMPGMPGGGGMPGMPGGGSPGVPQQASPPLFQAQVVVEVKKSWFANYPGEKGKPEQYLVIRHNVVPEGKTNLVEDGDLHFEYIALPSVEQRYKEKKKERLKDGKTVENYLELAEWALNHGRLDLYIENMAEVVLLDQNHPAARAFAQVEADMKRKVAKEDDSAFWKEKLSGYKLERSPHYSLLYNANFKSPPEVRRRLDLLEDNYRAFFYWFALKGLYPLVLAPDRVLTVPDHRLVAVLVDRPEEYEVQRQVLLNSPLRVADGFYDRTNELAVFSAKRLDPAYAALTKSTQTLWQNGWDQSKLLEGQARAGKSNHEVARAQTIALLLKAMELEGEREAVTHEGSRQLAAVVGLFPTRVGVPDWALFGLGSFFDTRHGAYWPGTGAPNWICLPLFKYYQQLHRLDPPEQAIVNVITDEYFRQAYVSPGRFTLDQAGVMSWSLFYFLAQRYPEGLLRYCGELANLPRDMEFDGEVLKGCFARAFNLTDTGLANQVSLAKLYKMGRDWYKFIDGTDLETESYMKELRKKDPRILKPGDPSKLPNQGKPGPNQPGQPGGGQGRQPGGKY
jgi:hypothetical protein